MLVCTQHALQKHVTVTLSVLAIGCGSKTELEVQAGSAALLVCGGLLVLLEPVCQSGGLLVCYWIISLAD